MKRNIILFDYHELIEAWKNISICVLLLLILMLWHRQVIFKSKVDKLSSSAECRIQTLEVWDTKSPAYWMPNHKPIELLRIKLKETVNTYTLALYIPGYQHPWCWLSIHYRALFSKRMIMFIRNNMRKWNCILKKKKIPSGLRVNIRYMSWQLSPQFWAMSPFHVQHVFIEMLYFPFKLLKQLHRVVGRLYLKHNLVCPLYENDFFSVIL